MIFTNTFVYKICVPSYCSPVEVVIVSSVNSYKNALDYF